MIKLCVVIPAWNEQKNIRRTIRSCYKAGLAPADVYVLDDGSTDDTRARVLTTGCQLHTAGNIGKEATIKRGIAHFGLFDTYDYITILDADSYLHLGYVAAIERAVERYPGVAAVSGAVRSQRGGWLTAYRAVETFLSTNVYREAQHLMGNITVAPGCSTTYATARFRGLDFDGGTLVEDMDWTVQFHRRGELVVQAMDAVIYTQDPATLRQLWGQVQRWHRGTWQVVRLRELCRCFWQPTLPITRIDSEFLLIIGEALLYGTLLALLPLWFYLSPRRAAYAILADQGVLLFFVVLTAIRDRRWDVIYMFPLFMVPRVMSYCSFVWAFAVTRRRGQEKLTWFRPERW